MFGGLVVDVAVELKNVVVELAAQLRSPNPYVGNPDLGVHRCAAESDNSRRMVGNAYLGISSGLPVIRPEDRFFRTMQNTLQLPGTIARAFCDYYQPIAMSELKSQHGRTSCPQSLLRLIFPQGHFA